VLSLLLCHSLSHANRDTTVVHYLGRYFRGATTLSITTFSIMTHGIATFSTITLGIATLTVMALAIATLGITTSMP